MSDESMQQTTVNEVILLEALDRIEQKLELLDQQMEQIRTQLRLQSAQEPVTRQQERR